MPDANNYLFASFAHRDGAAVAPIVKALRDEFRKRALDVDVWVQSDKLTPGERWEAQIASALRDSIGLLAFFSTSTPEESYANREIKLFTSLSDRLIFPIILEPGASLPFALRGYQALNASTPEDISHAARVIADATKDYLKSHGARSPVSPEAVPIAAAIIADSVRGVRPESTPTTKPPDSVFLVHGHDSKRLEEVRTYLIGLGVKPIVLSKIAGPSQSLFQKFLQFSKDARFAIVLLTADDVGASRIQYGAEGVGVNALQFRARQNVILELGFFYGYLGWENVFVISAQPDKVYPNFEPPSDLAGVVFDAIDDPSWQSSLSRKLSEAGFQLLTSS
jgi:predicted nucleotide-binding protein